MLLSRSTSSGVRNVSFLAYKVGEWGKAPAAPHSPTSPSSVEVGVGEDAFLSYIRDQSTSLYASVAYIYASIAHMYASVAWVYVFVGGQCTLLLRGAYASIAWVYASVAPRLWAARSANFLACPGGAARRQLPVSSGRAWLLGRHDVDCCLWLWGRRDR